MVPAGMIPLWRVNLTVWSLSEASLACSVSYIILTYEFSHHTQSDTYNVSSSVEVITGKVNCNQKPLVQEFSSCKRIPQNVLPMKFNTLTNFLSAKLTHENLIHVLYVSVMFRVTGYFCSKALYQIQCILIHLCCN